MKRIATYLILIASGSFALNTNAQDMVGFELDWSIDLNYYQVNMADNYFDDTSQYLAYAKLVDGSHNDTLVLFDYKNKNIIHQKGGLQHLIVRFVNNDRLLYYHADTLFSIDSFNAPVITPRFEFNGESLKNFILSPDNSYMVCLVNDSTVHLYNYDVTSNTVVFEKTFAINHFIQGYNLAMSSDNTYIAIESGYQRDSLTLINLSTDEVTETSTTQNDGTYSPVFFWQNSELKVAAGGGYYGGNIDVIDVGSKSHTHNIPMFQNYNYSLDVDFSSRYMVCGGFNHEIKLLNIQNMAFSTIDSVDTDSNIELLKFSTDAKYIISLHGGGEDKARINVFKVDTSTSTGSSDIHHTNDVNLFPNPVRDILTLEGLGKEAEIQLFDLSGKRVYQQTHRNNQIDLSRLDNGVYILKTLDKNNQFFHRTIVKY